jgi:hypothetical protein
VDFAEDYGVDGAEDPAFGCDVDEATDPESEATSEEFYAALAFLTGVEANPKYYDQSDDDDESEDPAFEAGDESEDPAFEAGDDAEEPAFETGDESAAPAFDAVGDTEAPAFDAVGDTEDYLFDADGDADDPAFDADPESLPDPLLLPLYISA